MRGGVVAGLHVDEAGGVVLEVAGEAGVIVVRRRVQPRTYGGTLRGAF